MADRSRWMRRPPDSLATVCCVANRRLLASPAIDAPGVVGVPAVPGVFLDHAHHEVPQFHGPSRHVNEGVEVDPLQHLASAGNLAG